MQPVDMLAEPRAEPAWCWITVCSAAMNPTTLTRLCNRKDGRFGRIRFVSLSMPSLRRSVVVSPFQATVVELSQQSSATLQERRGGVEPLSRARWHAKWRIGKHRFAYRATCVRLCTHSGDALFSAPIQDKAHHDEQLVAAQTKLVPLVAKVVVFAGG